MKSSLLPRADTSAPKLFSQQCPQCTSGISCQICPACGWEKLFIRSREGNIPSFLHPFSPRSLDYIIRMQTQHTYTPSARIIRATWKEKLRAVQSMEIVKKMWKYLSGNKIIHFFHIDGYASGEKLSCINSTVLWLFAVAWHLVGIVKNHDDNSVFHMCSSTSLYHRMSMVNESAMGSAFKNKVGFLLVLQ